MNDSTAHGSAPADIAALLGPARKPPRRGRLWFGFTAAFVVLGGLAWWLQHSGERAATTPWQTAAVTRGDLTVRVTATGTLQPTNQVDVGSELSGTVAEVLVDDNSRVTEGEVLARLDTARLEDQVLNARAALAAAQAGVQQAEATRDEATANLKRLREVYTLSDGKVPSKTELETAEASAARARANLASAAAAVGQAEATLRTNQTNLGKATIRSPINGVVLTRSVEPGQTVAASLQAPVLFTLAEDLARMELDVDVDEADVGQVRAGQLASFSVDAYPDRKYPAVITRVRYGATTTDNVVTYLTVLKVDNDDLSLRPGMTATAEIVTTQLHDAVLVPNAALRFTPPRSERKQKQSLTSMLVPHRPRAEKTVRIEDDGHGKRQVWVLRKGQPVAIEVTTGASDGRDTVITAGDLAPGTEVLTGTAGKAAE